MFNAKDRLLSELKPSSLSWNKFNNNCVLMINEGRFHSNEVSKTDDELVQKEVDINV
jgi:hypothetical protein